MIRRLKLSMRGDKLSENRSVINLKKLKVNNLAENEIMRIALLNLILRPVHHQRKP